MLDESGRIRVATEECGEVCDGDWAADQRVRYMRTPRVKLISVQECEYANVNKSRGFR
jgi:hypothetical protein